MSRINGFVSALLMGLLMSLMMGAAMVLVPKVAEAKVHVVATLPDLGSVVRYVGGNTVQVEVLCPGPMDPHFLPAKPSLARKVGKADLLVYNGMELEIGWLPSLIRKARNPDVRPGSRGDLDCSRAVPNLLEVPKGQVDRSEGDIHPLGNPHYSIDPVRMKAVATLIGDRLAELDPAHEEAYSTRAAQFGAEVDRRLPSWRAAAAPAVKLPVIIYHRHWTYLIDWLGLNVVGEIENRPGIAPAPRHVRQLIDLGKKLPDVLILAATWSHLDVARDVAKRTGGHLAIVPGQTGGVDGAEDYFSFMDTVCSRLGTAASEAENATQH